MLFVVFGVLVFVLLLIGFDFNVVLFIVGLGILLFYVVIKG